MLRLCIGETRAKTRVCSTHLCQNRAASAAALASSPRSLSSPPGGAWTSICAPVTTRNSAAAAASASPPGEHGDGETTPIRRAMASAVAGWSPVTITVRAPARAMRVTASATPSLGGSSSATRPRSAKPSNGKFTSSTPEPSKRKFGPRPGSGFSARHRTRFPCAMSRAKLASARARTAGSTAQKASTRSGAPLSTATKCGASRPHSSAAPVMACTVNIHLAELLNGISKTCGSPQRVASVRSLPRTCRHPAKIATSVGEPTAPPGAALSGLAPVFRTPQRAKARIASWPKTSWLQSLATGVSRRLSSDDAASIPSGPLPTGQGTAKSVAVIFPEVNVPVLSLQSTPIQPSVSTASIFRTRTWRCAICREAIMRQTVTVGKRPSGTWAKKAVAAFSRTSAMPRFLGEAMFATSESRPMPTATKAIKWTKCSIWISRDDLVREVRIFVAICPNSVLSPVPKTTPSIRPCSTVVPLKATFRASTSASPAGAASAVRGSATDSPVKAEFSTSEPSVQAKIRTSAGTLWPASSSNTSPGTNSSAGICSSTRSPP
mmetsp:Transcript_63311/g.160283  ORF Transcript_63311/g.160283 Transcript_63311/m.160283 type:complete len:550 (+) Transcript_63311:844-2493(+)